MYVEPQLLYFKNQSPSVSPILYCILTSSRGCSFLLDLHNLKMLCEVLGVWISYKSKYSYFFCLKSWKLKAQRAETKTEQRSGPLTLTCPEEWCGAGASDWMLNMSVGGPHGKVKWKDFPAYCCVHTTDWSFRTAVVLIGPTNCMSWCPTAKEDDV